MTTVKIIRGVYVDGELCSPGDEVQVADSVARMLVAAQQAERAEVTESDETEGEASPDGSEKKKPKKQKGK